MISSMLKTVLTYGFALAVYVALRSATLSASTG